MLQLPCGPWSKVKFEKDGGPQPIFTVDHPDGVPGDDHARGVAVAMEQMGRAREAETGPYTL